MSPVSALPAVEARIASIQQRLGIRSTLWSPAAGTSVYGAADTVELAPSDPTKGFDPFGAVYQEALDAAGPIAPSDPSSSAGVSSTSVESAGLGRTQRYAVAADPESDPFVLVSNDTWATNVNPGSTVGQIGGYGPMPVPTDLAAYGNGQLPDTALEKIGQGGHRLYAPAAEAWKSVVAAAADDGITLRITDSYRSYDQQVDLANRKGLYKNGGYAATPGTSNHGWGLAVDADVTDPATLTWLRANGHRFGFVEAVPREPWHWEFRPQQA